MSRKEIEMAKKAFLAYGETLQKARDIEERNAEEAEREEKVKQFIRDMHKSGEK